MRVVGEGRRGEGGKGGRVNKQFALFFVLFYYVFGVVLSRKVVFRLLMLAVRRIYVFIRFNKKFRWIRYQPQSINHSMKSHTRREGRGREPCARATSQLKPMIFGRCVWGGGLRCNTDGCYSPVKNAPGAMFYCCNR